MFFCKHALENTQTQRTLCDLRDGEKAVVRCLAKSTGCHVGKLAAMGITPGTEVEVLSNGRGPLMILVRSSRLCLCRGLARAVVVE